MDINEKAVQEAASKIAAKAPNVKVLGTKADVGKEEDVKAAVDKAVSEFGRLDIMVRSLPLVNKADSGSYTYARTVQQCGYYASRR